MKKLNFSRVLSGALALVMVVSLLFSLGVPALAEGTDCTIYFYQNGTIISTRNVPYGHVIQASDLPALGAGYTWKIAGGPAIGFVVRGTTSAHTSAHEHTWDTGMVTAPPTCGSEGVMTYTCSTCYDTKTEAIDATGQHTAEPVPGTDPTCTDPGLTQGSRCSVCGVTLQTQDPIPPTGHTFQPVDNVAPTCTQQGYTNYVCACGATKQDFFVDPLGHSPVLDLGKDATCEEDGLTQGHHCSVCGEITIPQEVIPATGHAPQAIPGVEATCVATGLTQGSKCGTCGEILTAQQVTPMKPHNYISSVTDPSCTAGGFTTYTCDYCGHSYTDSETAPDGANHSFTGTRVVDPTCTQGGYTLNICGNCGHEERKAGSETDPLGHTPETIPAVEATCTATGLTQGSKCSVCGEILTAQQTVPAKPHSYDSVVTAPTCSAGGYTTHTCGVCGHSYTDSETPADGTAHSYTGTRVVDPTCTQGGYTLDVCGNCGHEERKAGSETDPLGHTPEVIPAVGATCTATGLTQGSKCSVCGEILTAQQTVPMVDHRYTSAVTAPGCGTQGFTTHTCGVCGHSYQSDIIPATEEHVWDDGIVSREPSCGEEGQMAYTCTRCDAVRYAPIAATGRHIDTDLNNRCDVCGVRINSTGTSANPRTADLSNIPLWIGLIVVGMAGMAASVIVKKPRRR